MYHSCVPLVHMGYNVEKLIEATEKKSVSLKSKEDPWTRDMKEAIELKIKKLKMLYDFQQAYDRLEVKLEATLQKNVKAKKRLDIRKQQLAEAEETLAEKKEKLQRLHKDSAFESDLRASGRVSMMGSVDGRPSSIDQQRASFRASVDGIRASLNEGQRQYEERRSMRSSTAN